MMQAVSTRAMSSDTLHTTAKGAQAASAKSSYSRGKNPVPESYVFGCHSPVRAKLHGCYSQAKTVAPSQHGITSHSVTQRA